jgi:hypothetical protein
MVSTKGGAPCRVVCQRFLVSIPSYAIDALLAAPP